MSVESRARTRPRTFLAFLLVVAMAAPYWGCASLADDAAAFCRIAGEVGTDDTLPPEHRAQTLAKRFDAYGPDAKMRQIFEDLANVDPERRMEYLRASLAEGGVTDWSCPALERVFAL